MGELADRQNHETPSLRRAARLPVRAGLAALMLLTSVNVFTGAPLFAMWVGSRVEGSGPLTMGVVFAVIATLALVVFLLTQALVLIGRAYDSVTGRPPRRERPAWLRSMRDEPVHRQARGDELSMLEKALVASVVVGIVAFELWFFLAAGSPLPNST